MTQAPTASSAPTPPVADPLADADDVSRRIAAVTGESHDVVLYRLMLEYWAPGRTVSEDFARRRLPSHQWSDGLARFYGETDAFLYELAVWNRNWVKAFMRRSVGWYVAAHALRRGRRLRVLSIGDGLGFDSLELARAGHDVTYFELPGRSEAFARRLFADSGVAVAVATAPEDLPAESFDAVLCLDVLEHAPDPSAVVSTVARVLCPGGVALLSAPFFLILPWYPTHLKANRRHSGSVSLYAAHGLRLVDGSFTWAPLVLHKNAPGDPGPVNRLKVPLLRLVGLLLVTGRWFAWPFAVCHALRWLTNRWFTPAAAPASAGAAAEVASSTSPLTDLPSAPPD